MRLFVLALLTLSLAGSAHAQSPTTRIRGEVETAEGGLLTVKTVDGITEKVALAPGYSVGGVVKAMAADIRTGSFIGVGAIPERGGTLLAAQVFIFPESMRGTGEGHRPWGVLAVPDGTMTNAVVTEAVARVDGVNVMLTYPGGEQRVRITPEANIIMAVPAEASELKPGAQVVMSATKQADGSFTASRVTLAKGGATLPY